MDLGLNNPKKTCFKNPLCVDIYIYIYIYIYMRIFRPVWLGGGVKYKNRFFSMLCLSGLGTLMSRLGETVVG